jgi:hypothetical protein
MVGLGFGANGCSWSDALAIAAMADGTFTTRVDRIYQPPILQP